jgi:hypothetical protein
MPQEDQMRRSSAAALAGLATCVTAFAAAPPTFAAGLDDTFGVRGTAFAPLSGVDGSRYRAAAQAPGGGTYAVGYTTVAGGADQEVLVTRTDAAGDLVASFGTGGAKVVNLTAGPFDSTITTARGSLELATGIAVQSDGKLLVAGSATAANGQPGMLVARLLGISQADVGLPAQRIRRSTRTVQVRLACSPVQNCQGEAALAISRRHRRQVVGHGPFSIHSGASAAVAITLTRSGRARLAHRRATRATLTLDPQNGPQRVLRITVAPRKG